MPSTTCHFPEIPCNKSCTTFNATAKALSLFSVFTPQYMNVVTLDHLSPQLLLAISPSVRLSDVHQQSTPWRRPSCLRVGWDRGTWTQDRNVPGWLAFPSVCSDISRSQHGELRSAYRHLLHFPRRYRWWHSGGVPARTTSMLDPGALRRRVPRTMAYVGKWPQT